MPDVMKAVLWVTAMCIVLVAAICIFVPDKPQQPAMRYTVEYGNIVGSETFECQEYKHGGSLWQFFDKQGYVIREIDKASTWTISVTINPKYKETEN